MRYVLIAVVLCFGGRAIAQQCPKADPSGPLLPSLSQTLEGQLVFHNNLRGWFELRTESAVCGSNAVEVFPDPAKESQWAAMRRRIEQHRGCRVRTTGILGIPGTGYYSSDLYQVITAIEPVGPCILKAALPNFSKSRPKPGLNRYTVTLTFDYGTDTPLVGYVTSDGKRLGPWQAYAKYELTGGFVLYTYCAKGFGITTFSGASAAKPALYDGYLALDPETAVAARHVTHLSITYSCVKGVPTE